MLRQIILLAGFFCLATLCLAQHAYSNYPVISEQCGTSQLKKWKQQNIPNTESDNQFEEWLSHKISEMNFEEREGGIITIPTVVHVIHNGEAEGTYPNISDAQIISQINVLNQDFRRMEGTNGFNEHPDGADMEIEFCLAIVDPDLNPSDGIDRQNLANGSWGMPSIESIMKPNTIWNPEKYFNIWVCELSGVLLGHAQFPESDLEGPEGNGNADTDGIVVGAEYFGSIEDDDGTFILDNTYNLGRVATHEAGHFFGLIHIWGDGDCMVSDYCDDTPDSDAPNSGCPIGATSCGSVDMIENYMDYTDDVCANIFTNDQKARMQAVLMGSPRRASLENAVPCIPPSSFYYSGQVIDINTKEAIPDAFVAFKGMFGFEIMTDSEGVFNIPALYEGEYEILVGRWGYLTKFIPSQYFDDNTGDVIIQLESGYYDDFAFDFGWEVTGYVQTGAWERSIPLGSLYTNNQTNEEVQFDPESDMEGDYRNYCFLTENGGDSAGASDVDNGTTRLNSPIFNASLYENPKLSFYRWFATRGSLADPADDQLEISISNGSTTEIIKTIDVNDDNLSTWVYEEFIISNYIMPTDSMSLIVSVSDQVTSSQGHLVDAAIDLFKVEGYAVSVDDLLEEEIGFSLFPNPTNGAIIVEVETFDTNAEIQVFNALGQAVFIQEMLDHRIEINLENQGKGIYFLRFRQEEGFFIKKIMVR